jgi:hypothetical protein
MIRYQLKLQSYHRLFQNKIRTRNTFKKEYINEHRKRIIGR